MNDIQVKKKSKKSFSRSILSENSSNKKEKTDTLKDLPDMKSPSADYGQITVNALKRAKFDPDIIK